MSKQALFEKHVYEDLKKAIKNISGAQAHGIYAMSLRVDDDAGMWPEIAFGYNTLKQMAKSIKDASDEAEAKWNFAFWLHDEPVSIAGPKDVQGAALLEEWIKERGWYFTPEEQEEDFERTAEQRAEMLRELWWLTARVANQLHVDGVVIGKFGKPIPFIIHNLEYYDEVVAVCKAANPTECVQEFVAWVEAM